MASKWLVSTPFPCLTPHSGRTTRKLFYCRARFGALRFIDSGQTRWLCLAFAINSLRQIPVYSRTH